MSPGRRNIFIGAAAVLALGGGWGLRRLVASGAAGPAAIYELVLPGLNGAPLSLAQWKGKILVANFWATWCEPCREEIPMLIRMQAKYATKNVQLVGISIDSADKVREFSNIFKIDYPLLIGGLESLALLRQM